MSPPILIGILGTVFALAFMANGLRLVIGPAGHAANAGRLHIAMAGLFLPILWLVVLRAVL